METKIEIGIWRIRRYEERKNMNADFRIDGKVIETKRLILRSFKQTDLKDFYEYASVEGVGEMAGWKHHENIAESQSIMNSFISEDMDNEQVGEEVYITILKTAVLWQIVRQLWK